MIKGNLLNYIALGTAGLLAFTLPGFAKTVELKKKQSKVKGLLVIPLTGSKMAGKASQMNATATPSGRDDLPAAISFNQDVGESMGKALKEVNKFLGVRHDGFPKGYTIEVAFEEQYSQKDGPSAAVACALLVDALITGEDIDSGFAVTGDMNADGAVKGIGGVADKIRGAASRDCTIVAVPDSNVKGVSDLVITQGIEPLFNIQVFSVSTFDQAHALSRAKRDPKIQKALDDFSKVQALLKRKPAKQRFGLLKNKKVQAMLMGVGKAMPNHLSAKYLYLVGVGKPPKKLSLHGSLVAIDSAGEDLLSASRSWKGRAGGDALQRDDLAETLNDLRNIRVKCDKRSWAYLDTLDDFGDLFHEWQTNLPRSDAGKIKLAEKIMAAGERIDAAITNLHENKEVMEELIR